MGSDPQTKSQPLSGVKEMASKEEIRKVCLKAQKQVDQLVEKLELFDDELREIWENTDKMICMLEEEEEEAKDG